MRRTNTSHDLGAAPEMASSLAALNPRQMREARIDARGQRRSIDRVLDRYAAKLVTFGVTLPEEHTDKQFATHRDIIHPMMLGAYAIRQLEHPDAPLIPENESEKVARITNERTTAAGRILATDAASLTKVDAEKYLNEAIRRIRPMEGIEVPGGAEGIWYPDVILGLGGADATFRLAEYSELR